ASSWWRRSRRKAQFRAESVLAPHPISGWGDGRLPTNREDMIRFAVLAGLVVTLLAPIAFAQEDETTTTTELETTTTTALPAPTTSEPPPTTTTALPTSTTVVPTTTLVPSTTTTTTTVPACLPL